MSGSFLGISEERPDGILQVLPLRFENSDVYNKAILCGKGYRIRLVLKNTSNLTLRYYLSFANWSVVKAEIRMNDSRTEQQSTGNFIPLFQRSVPMYQSLIELKIPSQGFCTIEASVIQKMGFYLPEKFELELIKDTQLMEEDRQRLFYQGIFLGVILVMAMYNLLMYLSVKDNSSFYYSLSLVGVGLYFMFYYGFTLELLWGNYPVWNAYFFAFAVPLTRITWILFTQSYLHLKEELPVWNKILNLLILLYLIPVLSGAVNYLFDIDLTNFTVAWIGALGVTVLSLMILVAFLTLRKGYKPAFYFLVANLFFSFGSILFIFRETHFLADNLFTRYAVQIGVILQTVLFSFGLAYRINSTQKELAEKKLEAEILAKEKEIEKKLLIENQKKELEMEVAQRTRDLMEKTEELEVTVDKLQASEANLRELNHIKDKFFSIISHDLRSPLATLQSFLNILTGYTDHFSKEELSQLAMRTRLAMDSLSSLLDNLLKWAMAQMEQYHLQPEKVDPRKTLERVVQQLQSLMAEKNISLNVQLENCPSLHVDENILEFLLRNLLSNALKFTARGGKVEIYNHSVEMRIQEICIKDNGIGISQEQLDKLFHFHFSGQISTKGTENEKGIGLGLVLCKEFVELSGGKLEICSQSGQGTEVKIHLPVFKEIAVPVLKT